MTPRRISLLEGALFAVAGLGLGGLRVAAPAEGGIEREPAPASAAQAEVVDCAELLAHPGRYLGRELVVRVQFREWIGSWNPYLTRFGSGQYRAFAAWGEEQFPWVQADFDAPQARLFVRRGSAADWAFETATTFARFELSIAVRAVFDDLPWAEVLGVRPQVRSITEGSVLHASRALGLMERRAWELAQTEFERALGAPLPQHALLELERLRDLCREERALLEQRPLLRGRPR